MDSIRLIHEEVASHRFLSIYNSIQNQTIDFVRLGIPKLREPDCICSNSIALELVGVYDNEYQAEKIWALARGKMINKKPDLKLFTLDNLESSIGEKMRKLERGHYDGFPGKIILVCNLHSPLLQDQEVEQYVKEYSSFRQDNYFDRYFNEIWIKWISDTDGNEKIRRLE